METQHLSSAIYSEGIGDDSKPQPIRILDSSRSSWRREASGFLKTNRGGGTNPKPTQSANRKFWFSAVLFFGVVRNERLYLVPERRLQETDLELKSESFAIG